MSPADFRERALEFLCANSVVGAASSESGWGRGDDSVGLLDGYPDRAAEAAAVERAREWRRCVYDNGFGWLGGPVHLGGAGLDPALDEEYRLLEAGFDVPDQQPFGTGIRLVAPAVVAHGEAACSVGSCRESIGATSSAVSSSASGPVGGEHAR